jgi:ADP-ribose pyrophosphatase YjhB (NUDIX family)
MSQSLPNVAERDWFTDPAKRRLGVHTLLTSDTGRDTFLLVTRPYKNDAWGLPGGSVAQDELPRDALRRVTKAKLGLSVEPLQRVATDRVPKSETTFEGLNEIFYGIFPENGVVTLGGGYGEYRWVTPEEARELLVGTQLTRFAWSMQALSRGYTEELIHGEPAWSWPTTP